MNYNQVNGSMVQLTSEEIEAVSGGSPLQFLLKLRPFITSGGESGRMPGIKDEIQPAVNDYPGLA